MFVQLYSCYIYKSFILIRYITDKRKDKVSARIVLVWTHSETHLITFACFGGILGYVARDTQTHVALPSQFQFDHWPLVTTGVYGEETPRIVKEIGRRFWCGGNRKFTGISLVTATVGLDVHRGKAFSILAVGERLRWVGRHHLRTLMFIPAMLCSNVLAPCWSFLLLKVIYCPKSLLFPFLFQHRFLIIVKCQW